jgi:hypothetical protein
MNDLARILIVMGLAITLIGVVILVAVRFFPWLGHLPGDIRYEGENFNLYIPLGTMILISVVGTLLLNIVIRIFRR